MKLSRLETAPINSEKLGTCCCTRVRVPVLSQKLSSALPWSRILSRSIPASFATITQHCFKLRQTFEFRVPYSQLYLFNAISDTNYNANPTNHNRDSKVVWRYIVVSALASINEVNLRRARLVLRWATVSRFNSRCRTFISVCNQPATQGQLSLPSLRGR